tara:strand:- start:141 stop:518 length:378 start_codon:yes stop_codon:yes gene_type:complete
MWYQFLLVASGGACGAMARYSTGILVRSYVADNWPLATLLVNVLGSFGIGIVFVLLERSMVHHDLRSFLVVGFFGAFTTFSTFSLELLHMIERGEGVYAAGYASLSVLACLVGVMIGVYAGRLLG